MLSGLRLNKRSLRDQLVLFGTGFSFLFMFPFPIYRLSIGDFAIAAVDFLIVVVMGIIFAQAWHSKSIKFVNASVVAALMTGVLWIIHLKGFGLIFWAFPTVGFSYFILKSKNALISNIIFISCLCLMFMGTLTKNQALSIYPSLLVICFFGFVFSLCAEIQNKNLLKLVTEDTLTGVNNRRSLDDKVEEILGNKRRNPNPVSMLILDLDHFKNVNDSYGHKKGDQVLIDFANTVKATIRSTDYVYRFGGEEFVVIANNAVLRDAGALAESIREEVMLSPKLSQYKVTVSIGVAEVLENDDAESCFRRADHALYESKDTGRNKVSLATIDEKNNTISTSHKIKSISGSRHNTVINKRDERTEELSHFKQDENQRASTGTQLS